MGKKMSAEELRERIKNDLKIMLDSDILESITHGSKCTTAIAELVWNTKEFMNHLQMTAPYDQYVRGRERMVSYDAGRDDLGLSIYAPEQMDDEKTEPAYITDGYDNEHLSRNFEYLRDFIQANFTMDEQLELLLEILRWYKQATPSVSNINTITEAVNTINIRIKNACDEAKSD